jgi:hypothetical protein
MSSSHNLYRAMGFGLPHGKLQTISNGSKADVTKLYCLILFTLSERS